MNRTSRTQNALRASKLAISVTVVGAAMVSLVGFAPAASANDRSHLVCPPTMIIQDATWNPAPSSTGGTTTFTCIAPDGTTATQSINGNHTAYA